MEPRFAAPTRCGMAEGRFNVSPLLRVPSDDFLRLASAWSRSNLLSGAAMQDAVADYFQMQLAHPAHDGLTVYGVCFNSDGRICWARSLSAL
jgi:hypothetical protein